MPSSTFKKEVKKAAPFLWIHLVLTSVLSLISLCVFERWQAYNFIAGQLFVCLSLATIALSVYVFFLKKNIALLVSVIVFKWPILIIMVYQVTKIMEMKPVFLALGFLPVFVSSLIWSKLQKDWV